MRNSILKSEKLLSLFLASAGLLTLLAACALVTSHASNPSVSTSAVAPPSGSITLVANFAPNLTPVGASVNTPTSNNPQGSFDFDIGAFTMGGGADISLAVSCGSACFNIVDAMNGAKPAWVGSTKPGYDGCRTALQSVDSEHWISARPGDYSCIQTSRGNIVQIVVRENEARAMHSTIVLDYQLWIPSQLP